MIPNATPQTATRRTRSQSPPRRTQRKPVSAIAAAIASSSISPYMWIVTGPRSTVPLCGDGMYARITATGWPFCPETPLPVRLSALAQNRRHASQSLEPGTRAKAIERLTRLGEQRLSFLRPPLAGEPLAVLELGD